MKTRRVTYRRLSNLRLARLMSRSVTTEQLDDEDSAGWTTYGTLSEESFMPRATP